MRVVESEMRRANIGLRHGCVMSLWVFSLYMDGLMRRKCKDCYAGEWGQNIMAINKLTYVFDTVLIADSTKRL